MNNITDIVYMPVKLIQRVPGGTPVQAVLVLLVVLYLIKKWKGEVPFGLGEYLSKIPLIGKLYEPCDSDDEDHHGHTHHACKKMIHVDAPANMTDVAQQANVQASVPATMSGPIATAMSNTEAMPTSQPAPVAPVQVGERNVVVPMLPQQQ